MKNSKSLAPLLLALASCAATPSDQIDAPEEGQRGRAYFIAGQSTYLDDDLDGLADDERQTVGVRIHQRIVEGAEAVIQIASAQGEQDVAIWNGSFWEAGDLRFEEVQLSAGIAGSVLPPGERGVDLQVGAGIELVSARVEAESDSVEMSDSDTGLAPYLDLALIVGQARGVSLAVIYRRRIGPEVEAFGDDVSLDSSSVLFGIGASF